MGILGGPMIFDDEDEGIREISNFSKSCLFEIKMAFEIKWPTASRKFLEENASITYEEIEGFYRPYQGILHAYQ